MKLITRDTDYAVRALCYLAKHKNGILPVSELVNRLKIPRPFLRKILQVLHKQGILRAYKGRGGGFLLEVPAGKIRLLEVMSIFQGPLSLNECFFKKVLCPKRKDCCLRKKIAQIQLRAFGDLKKITIGSLLRG
jgi:Rrf2 family protein